MKELIIGILCCLAMAGSLLGYLAITKKKYYDGHDQPSLSNTFYKTRWKFRVLLVAMAVLLVYPVLLANGIYDSGIWYYYAPSAVIAWAKLCLAICMGGIIGVALNADYLHNESTAHVAAASWFAAAFAIVGCCLRPDWYIGVGIWLAWLVYYLVKQYRNHKAGNPNAWGLYVEMVAFMSVPTCLIVYMLMNYLE